MRRDADTEASVFTVMIPICPLISNLMSVYWWSAMTTVVYCGCSCLFLLEPKSQSTTSFDWRIRFTYYDTSESHEEKKKHGGPGTIWS